MKSNKFDDCMKVGAACDPLRVAGARAVEVQVSTEVADFAEETPDGPTGKVADDHGPVHQTEVKGRRCAVLGRAEK